MQRHRRAALSLALGLMVIAPIGGGAGAQESAPGAIVDSWAVSPSSPGGVDSGARTNLSYDVAPGAAINDSITLFNLGTTPKTFHVYATDAFNNTNGDFDLLTGDKPPSDAGSWVTMAQASVELPPGSQADVPFRFVVPGDARPGDHAAAILASSMAEGRDSEGRVVALDRRTGTRLYLRVAGALQPALVVENVHTTYHSALSPLGGSVDLSYTVRNTGNVRLGAHQEILVKNPFGRMMKRAGGKDIAELLPGNAVTFNARFDHVTAALRITAQVGITPFVVGRPDQVAGPVVTGAAHAWAVPWSVLAVVLVVGLGWRGSRRARARHEPAEVLAGIAGQGPPGRR